MKLFSIVLLAVLLLSSIAIAEEGSSGEGSDDSSDNSTDDSTTVTAEVTSASGSENEVEIESETEVESENESSESDRIKIAEKIKMRMRLNASAGTLKEMFENRGETARAMTLTNAMAVRDGESDFSFKGMLERITPQNIARFKEILTKRIEFLKGLEEQTDATSARIAELEALQAKLDTVTSTKPAVNTVIKEYNHLHGLSIGEWAISHQKEKINPRMENAFEKLGKVLERFNTIQDRLESNGKDTSRLDNAISILTQIRENLAKKIAFYKEELNNLDEQIDGSTELTSEQKEGIGKMRKHAAVIHLEMKIVKEKLQAIISHMKEKKTLSNLPVESVSDIETDVQAEVDEEFGSSSTELVAEVEAGASNYTTEEAEAIVGVETSEESNSGEGEQ